MKHEESLKEEVANFRREEAAILRRYQIAICKVTSEPSKRIRHDGVVCPEVYFSPTNFPRLLFILKIPRLNQSDPKDEARYGGGAYIDWVRSGCDGVQYTWGPLSRWIYLTFERSVSRKNYQKLLARINRTDPCFMSQQFKNVAFLNICKYAAPIGEERVHLKKVLATEGCRISLLEQIRLYKPDIVICCGTGWWIKNRARSRFNGLLGDLLENTWSKSNDDIGYVGVNLVKGKTTFLADCFHPAAQGWARDKMDLYSFDIANTVHHLLKD